MILGARARAIPSVHAQTLRYLWRPHVGLPTGPVGGPAAWRGDELVAHPERWIERLGPREQDTLDAAVAHARGTGKPLHALTADDLPLGPLAARVAAWRAQLRDGLGVLVLRGVPVDRWSVEDAERFFWALGQHLGRPGAQNRHGDLLGHVRDQGLAYDDPDVRGYQTAAGLSLHCDLADVVGLLCLTTPRAGGASRFVSSVTVFDTLRAEAPELAATMFEPFTLDTRGDGGLRYLFLHPCRFDGRRLRTFYMGDYFRSFTQHPGAPPLPDRHRRALDAWEAIAARPGMAVDLQFEVGDVQLLSNHTVLHARTAYTDWDAPERKRHLLRLWLSLDAPAPLSELPARLRAAGALLGLAARLAAHHARSR